MPKHLGHTPPRRAGRARLKHTSAPAPTPLLHQQGAVEFLDPSTDGPTGEVWKAEEDIEDTDDL